MEKLLTECLSPLDNDLLLETILEALPSAELVRGRLVSKRWEECATKVLKKRRDLVIKLNCKTIGKFISSMESSRKQPFACFDLQFVYYGDENFRKFTQVCGDSVKALSFELNSNTRSKRLISNNLPYVPFARLESLSIDFLDANVGVFVLPYFGQRFPNITKLSLSSTTIKILRAVFSVADWGLNLKELELDFEYFQGDNWINHRDCGICGFSYEWINGVGEKLLKDNDQGAILREAEAWNRRSGGTSGITQFPNLEKLSHKEEYLHISLIEGPIFKCYFISDLAIYFALVNLKRLRSLSISGGNTITPDAVKYLKDNCPLLRSVVIEDA